MKLFFTVFIIILSLQSWTKADDINEYEIEGISLGDSAIEFFTEEQILERKKVGFIYPKDDFYSATIFQNPKFQLYDNVQFHIKKNDNNYIIYSISGQKEFPNDIDSCYKELESIILEFKRDFEYIDFYDSGIIDHADKTSGTVRSIYITFKKGDEIVAECYDYNKITEENKGFKDKLSVALDSKEFSQWLRNVWN